MLIISINYLNKYVPVPHLLIERPFSLANFYPVQYDNRCYLFAKEAFYPYSSHFGQHDALTQACADIGAAPVRIGSDAENTAVAGMACKAELWCNEVYSNVK